MIVHQLLTSLVPGDAISNEALTIRRILLEEGHESRIFGYYHHASLASHFTHSSQFPLYAAPEALLLYHFSIGSPVSKIYFQSPGRKGMIYHNITPHAFFLDYHRILAKECYKGRKELETFVKRTDLALGDSEYNRRELEELGFPKTGVLPIVADFSLFDTEPNPVTERLLKDDKFTLLFVGRIIPNKKIDDLLRLFAVYQKYYNPNSRLILAGEYRGFERYLAEIQQIVGRYDLKEVWIPGHVPFDDLVAYYRRADLYLSLSEHEGFGVPLLEAFHNKIPVIAYDAAAVAETMNGGGLLIKSKDPERICGLIEALRNDPSLRKRVVQGEEKALEKYRYHNIRSLLLDHLERLKG